jgi:hypothetical protein
MHLSEVESVHRSLAEADQQRYAETFIPYLQVHSGQYVYRIKGKEATEAHLQQIGEVVYLLLEELQETYAQEPAYHVLKRILTDNFHLEAQAVRPKTDQELDASCLQSCDDLEATLRQAQGRLYRRKGLRTYKGYVANLSETCDPENELQLITKIQVAPNNTNDNALLLKALPDLNERPGVETLYTDGPYAGLEVDQAEQLR